MKFAVQQFDIVENANPVTRSRYPFVVVLQHNRVATAATVIVAPLTAANSTLAASRLHPSINVGSRSYLLLTEELRRFIAAHLAASSALQSRSATRSSPQSTYVLLDYDGDRQRTTPEMQHGRRRGGLIASFR